MRQIAYRNTSDNPQESVRINWTFNDGNTFAQGLGGAMSGTGSVTVSISGGTGDADLYVKFGSAPTTTSYDCRPYLNGSNESCSIPRQAGTVYVMVKGYAAYSGVSLLGKF
jgi:hypothetical protein